MLTTMIRRHVLVTAAILFCALPFSGTAQAPAFTGSESCRECHERFHGLWSTSRHGLAMQPYTDTLGKEFLTPQIEDIVVGEARYRAHVGPGEGFVREVTVDGERDYPMEQVLGGKNVYYFLTPLERGRLQTLPVAYDVPKKQWYDMAGSGVRHLRERRDEAYHWTDVPYTFNTSCYGCHVSQLSTNYDLATDTYSTTWAEPGINCETCHGGASEHIRVCREAPEGEAPEDLKLIVVMQKHGFSSHQVNAACSNCHAKMSAITDGFTPGDNFFDNYDLITFEHTDYHLDGRDLGENYTYTLWRMNPCAQQGKLDCMYCHTSSGRYRFAEPEKANDACVECHEERVKNATAHTHHSEGSEGNRCVSCHMPTTQFAAMRRSDHSMRPPMPGASLVFGSPDACTLCHKDKDPAWADGKVREWHADDFQAETLHLGGLLREGRDHDWSRLDEMLAYLKRDDHDEIYANSLVRLIRSCPDPRREPVLRDLVKNDPSPLVRASAADALGDNLSVDSIGVLAAATADPYRLVRVRAAAVLAPVPPEMIPEARRKDVARATSEFLTTVQARSDDWTSYYNLGNFHMSRREFADALRLFETAEKLRPDAVAPLVNASLAYNAQGQNGRAEASLRRAIAIDPESTPAYLNLGMLLGELGRKSEAVDAFRKAFELDDTAAVAAFNLGVITAATDLGGGIEWCRKAYGLRPGDVRYAYTLAFYLRQHGDLDGAVAVLLPQCDAGADHPDSYMLLADIYAAQGDTESARQVYKQAAGNMALPERVREGFKARLGALEQL